jgi:hypothetical protein
VNCFTVTDEHRRSRVDPAGVCQPTGSTRLRVTFLDQPRHVREPVNRRGDWELLGMSGRNFRRLCVRYEEEGSRICAIGGSGKCRRASSLVSTLACIASASLSLEYLTVGVTDVAALPESG